MSLFKYLFIVPIFFCCLILPHYCTAEELKSPNGELLLTFDLEQGRPTYSLSYKGKAVINPSHLGLELKNDDETQRSMFDGFEIKESTPVQLVDDEWNPVWGETKTIRNRYQELAIVLEQTTTDRVMVVRFRLFDDGLGFRYEFPEQEKLVYYIVKEEKTQFAMSGDHIAFWLPGDYDTQEYNYAKSKLSEISALFDDALDDNASQTQFSDTGVQTPLMMKTEDGLYIDIHEAALVNYSCMHLNLNEDDLIFEHG